MENETDFCDRIPGCHTGRLSLELQASEAAEWQLRLEQMEKETQRLRQWIARQEAKIREMTESPSDGESSTGIEIDAAATPSAAVGASEPVAGDHKEWCDGAKEFCERQVESDTVPRAEYDRVLTLNHHLREVAVMAITERVPSDSKPTNCINPESEDTPPRGNDAPATGKPFQLEHGKQYLRRDGKVSGVMTQTKGGEYSVSHPLWDAFHCLSYRPDGSYNVSEAEDKFDLISEYHEPEPIPPAESEVDRLQRELDAAVEYHDNYTSKIDKALGQPRHGGDLLTEHLREIERLTYAIAWMPATPPTHPKAPPVVPKTRTVTLREYSLFEGTSSAVRSWTEIIPGLPWKDTCRTCECEVPE